MSRLLQEYSKALVQGLSPDLPNDVSPFFRRGKNVVFKDQSVQPASGQLFLANVGETTPVKGMRSSLISGTPTLFLGTLDKLYTYDGAITERGSGFSGQKNQTPNARATAWSFGSWGQWIMATNGQDKPQLSKDGGNFSDLTGDSPATAEVLITDSPHMLAFNTDRGGNAIEWCDAGDIEAWAATQSNSAGALFELGLSSDIIAGLKLRDQPIYLSRNELGAVRYVGPPLIYGSEVLLEGIGVVGKQAAVSTGDQVFGFGPKGIWRTNGSNYEYADSPWVREYVYDNLNQDQSSKVVAWFNSFDSLVVFFYPTGQSEENDTAVAFDLNQKIWTIYGYGRSAIDHENVFDFGIVADQFGKIYYTDVATVPFADQKGQLALDEGFKIRQGYGQGGYGQLGYGGYIGKS